MLYAFEKKFCIPVNSPQFDENMKISEVFRIQVIELFLINNMMIDAVQLFFQFNKSEVYVLTHQRLQV